MKYKLILDDENYLTGFVHTETSEDEFEMSPQNMMLDYLNCYKFEDGVLFFDEDKKAKLIEEEKLKAEEEMMKPTVEDLAEALEILTDIVLGGE